MILYRPSVNAIINEALKPITLVKTTTIDTFTEIIYGVKAVILNDEHFPGELKGRLNEILVHDHVLILSEKCQKLHLKEIKKRQEFTLVKNSKWFLILWACLTASSLALSLISAIGLQIALFLIFAMLKIRFEKKLAQIRKDEATVIQGKLYCLIYDELSGLYTKDDSYVA